MIRLAVSSEDVLWHDVGSRLHGAAIETGLDLSAIRSLSDCDAVVVGDDVLCSMESLQVLSISRKPALRLVGKKFAWDEIKTWCNASTSTNTSISWVNPDRFLPSRQLIRQQLDAGKLGEPGLVRIHRWRSNDVSDGFSSNDKLPVVMVRDLDMALWLIGRSPNLVYAVESPPSEPAAQAGRFIQVHLGFEKGGMALIDFSDRMPDGDQYDSLSVIGSTGAAYSDDQSNRQLLFRGGAAQAVRTDEGVRQHVAMVQEFVDAVAENRDLSASVESWKTVLNVASAVLQSLVTRRSVRWEGC